MRLHWDGIEWGWHQYPKEIQGVGLEGEYLYWFYWWNWLPKEVRYWGLETDWYDGPLPSFGFWYFNWSWRTPWTSWKE